MSSRHPRIRAVVFDLGGVLVGDFGSSFFPYASRRFGVPPAQVRRAVRRTEPLLQLGQISLYEFCRRTSATLHRPALTRSQCKQLLVASYRKGAPVNRSMLRLVRNIATRYPIGLLSNTIPEHTTINRARGVFRPFGTVQLSHVAHMRKPDPRSFRMIARSLGVRLSSILFVDDELRYVRAARRATLQAIQFRSEAQLRRRLKTLGILKP